MRETNQTHVASEQAGRDSAANLLLLEAEASTAGANRALVPERGDAGFERGANRGEESGDGEVRAGLGSAGVRLEFSHRRTRSGPESADAGDADERALSGALAGPPEGNDGTAGARLREFQWVVLDTVLRNKSTAAICVAGFAANLVTGVLLFPHGCAGHLQSHPRVPTASHATIHGGGRCGCFAALSCVSSATNYSLNTTRADVPSPNAGLAWGLIATWARDGLRFNADARNFAASCYSLPKGLAMARRVAPLELDALKRLV